MSKKHLYEEVRERMIKKFDTIGKFCRCAGIDRNQMQKDLYCEKRKPKGNEDRTVRFVMYSRLVREVSPLSDPDGISSSLRAEIEKAINEHGGVKVFCEKNDFVLSSVYSIISGRRSRLTDEVKRLCEFLKIDH